MTRRIIVSVRDMMQLGLDELNVVAREFGRNTLQALGNTTQENSGRSKMYMYAHIYIYLYIYIYIILRSLSMIL